MRTELYAACASSVFNIKRHTQFRAFLSNLFPYHSKIASTVASTFYCENSIFSAKRRPTSNRLDFHFRFFTLFLTCSTRYNNLQFHRYANSTSYLFIFKLIMLVASYILLTPVLLKGIIFRHVILRHIFL